LSAFSVGAQFGPYEVVSAVGAGGMGEVYRARDTRLKRDVALKILPEAFASNPDRVARFTREAQTLAALNHPNIAHIHGIEETGTVRALVMEFVDGEDLAQRIARGKIPVSEALPIARQIAEALAAAHEQGIIHRDLKPANVKVREDGTVKVLDFGLAKALDPASANQVGQVTNSPTITSPALMTGAGVLLGTAAYMSPEQAKGRLVDKRSDIWALGCVLFEMLTGARVFQISKAVQPVGTLTEPPSDEGESIAETLASVIMKDPDWSLLPADTPPPIHRLLRRCLEKDRRRRLESAADARLELDEALSGPTLLPAASVSVVSPRPRVRRWIGIAVVVALAAGAIASVSTWWMFRPLPARIVRLSVSPSNGVPFGDGYTASDVAITPDRSRIVYTTGVSRTAVQLFVRNLDQLEAVAIKGLNAPRAPFISPDGEWIGYFDDATLKKVPINGGPAVTICTLENAGNLRSASWGDDGTIIFSLGAAGGGLYRVSAGGGTPDLLLKPDATKGEGAFLEPEILPGSKSVLFVLRRPGGIGASRIAAVDLATKTIKVLTEGGNPHYLASGHLVFAAAGVIRAVPFDNDRLEMHGTPVGLVEGVATKTGGSGFAVANFAVSQNGTLAYRTGDFQADLPRTLVWVDREGHEEAVGVPNRTYAYVRLSPDASQIAADIRDQENDIWVWDVRRQGPWTRLTFDPGINRGVAWTLDGTRIAFSAERDGKEDIYWQSFNGSGAPERLVDASAAPTPISFAPGDRLLFTVPSFGPFDLWSLDLKSHRAQAMLHGSQSETNGEVSPDGKWLAYESDESKQRTEVYIRPFPNVDDGRWQVSSDGGNRPVWSKSGRELYYQTGLTGEPSTKIMAVTVTAGATPGLGTPQLLFEGPYLTPQAGRPYDVSGDGKRFLMIKSAEPPRSTAAAPQSQLNVVLNWSEEVKQRVPR